MRIVGKYKLFLMECICANYNQRPNTKARAVVKSPIAILQRRQICSMGGMNNRQHGALWVRSGAMNRSCQNSARSVVSTRCCAQFTCSAIDRLQKGPVSFSTCIPSPLRSAACLPRPEPATSAHGYPDSPYARDGLTREHRRRVAPPFAQITSTRRKADASR